MSNLFKSNKYIYFILLHAILGLVVSSFLIVSKVLSILIVVVGVLYIIKSKDKNNEALFFAAYVCGIEIFLRMTGGAFFNEYGKYVISLFCLLGVLFHPVQISKLLFIFLFLLLIPSLFIGLLDSSYEINLRKSVIFNISGELCLLACCLYTFGKKIDFKQLINLVYVISLPIVSIVVYISTHTLFADNVYVSTTSNFASSGGFGPNQVSTILGLGTFCFFVLFILKKSIPYEKFLYLGLFIYTAYRGVVTFSRGGMICALIMILVFIGILFIYTNEKTKFRILVFSFISIIGFLLFWGFVSYTTDGLIVKRYNNQDAIGREKISKLSGRETLIESEWDMFLENPILGVGVGRNSEIRLEELGIRAASHNEITRLLAEHGSLGIIYLFIIIVLPFVVWYNNRQHLLLIPFFIFWILTINHAAMRMAAPAFIYSLCLLNVIINFEKKTKNENSLHRKQITS